MQTVPVNGGKGLIEQNWVASEGVILQYPREEMDESLAPRDTTLEQSEVAEMMRLTSPAQAPDERIDFGSDERVEIKQKQSTVGASTKETTEPASVLHKTPAEPREGSPGEALNSVEHQEEENSLSREVEDTKNRGLEGWDEEDDEEGLIQDNDHGLGEHKAARESKEVKDSNPYIED